MERLNPGDVIANGSPVIHYTHLRDRQGGEYAYGVALCIDKCGGLAYAVWEVVWQHEPSNLRWSASGGDYFEAHELDAAIERYRARCGVYA